MSDREDSPDAFPHLEPRTSHPRAIGGRSTEQVVNALLEQVLQECARRRTFPAATYRLQFHSGFTFRDAAELVPYLHDLGISHCYASPYLKARPGSQHGYDITDHRTLNPEVGSEEDYASWLCALQIHGLAQILDWVPNHMGIGGSENVWWNEVLEQGPASPYAGFFDIAWYSSPRLELRGKILLPILGESYGRALESQQVRLSCTGGAFAFHYFEHRLPVAPRSYARILSQRVAELTTVLGANAPPLIEYQSILTAIEHLPARSETRPAKVAEGQREKEVIKRRLAVLMEESAAVRDSIEQTLVLYNGVAGDSHSFDLLDQLLDEQAYRLAYWRVAADEINYRRFFDINDLAALSMERPEVFTATHELLLRLLCEGKVQGVRIDHIDGLYDPRQYLQRLQQQFVLACARRLYDTEPAFQEVEWSDLEALLREQLTSCLAGGPWPLYVVVEKILGAAEPLPTDWPTCGTSGYDFLTLLNGLFVDTSNAQAFTRLYQEWTQDDTAISDLVYQKKYLILQTALSSELHMLAHLFDRLAQKSRWSRDFTFHGLRQSLREVIACFPVYRSYITEGGVSETDAKYIQTAVKRARNRNPALSAELFDFVRDMLLLHYPESASEEDRAEQQRFVGKFQQVTAPVMAKGLEDTACYVYNRLLSLNDVGGDPARFGLAPGVVHRYLQERQAQWPWALSTTSTHDTKRSEDVRARLNVLSELPREWQECLLRWSRLNLPHRIAVEETPVPDPNEEYLFYQTLLGAWPLEPYSATEYADFVTRIQAYLQKALHEAKVHASWINRNPAYADALQQFVARALDPEFSGAFLEDVRAFQLRLSHYGLFNSLAQVLLKITAPGVPDIYQGCELWDFSLVDPDNRRPVAYERRQQLLHELQDRADSDRRELARELTTHKDDGRIKLYVTSQALQCRRARPQLFATGEYYPLEMQGAKQDHLFGFARRDGDTWVLVLVPRFLTRLIPNTGDLPLGEEVWRETQVILPELCAGLCWRNLFSGETLRSLEHSLRVGEVLGHFPVALLLSDSVQPPGP